MEYKTITALESCDSKAVTYMIRGKMMSIFLFGFRNRFTSIFYHGRKKK